MVDEAENGHREAHTHRAAAPSAQLDAAAPIAGADPLDLIDGLPSIEESDVLAVAAELVAAPRRARGRPPGAANRKNADMIAYLAAKGHRDPWVTLSMIQTADTLKLAELLGDVQMSEGAPVMRDGKPVIVPANPLAVLSIQRQAAKDLMDYHHAKKPVQMELPPGAPRPVMVLGDMNVAVQGDMAMMLAGFRPPAEKPNEINGDVVRQDDGLPHEKPSD